MTALAALVAASGPAGACSRILWNNNGKAVVVGRTMDWPGSTEPELFVFPRGMARDGGLLGPARVVEGLPLRWTSRYGSLITSMYGLGSADGLNEKGLSAQLQFFTEADYGGRDPSRPGLQAGLWAQYLLDNAATVAEALKAMEGIQLVMAEARGFRTTLHLALSDAEGDSAIVEFIGGRMVVHHGRDYRVMTNDPAYERLLALVKEADFSSATAYAGLSPVDRFLRATRGLSLLSAPKTEQEAVEGVRSLARQVSVENLSFRTEYRTIGDLGSRRYHFELAEAPESFQVDLTRFNLEPGSPVLALKPDLRLAGEVSARFQAAKAPF